MVGGGMSIPYGTDIQTPLYTLYTHGQHGGTELLPSAIILELAGYNESETPQSCTRYDQTD